MPVTGTKKTSPTDTATVTVPLFEIPQAPAQVATFQNWPLSAPADGTDTTDTSFVESNQNRYPYILKRSSELKPLPKKDIGPKTQFSKFTLTNLRVSAIEQIYDT